jgi:uncharacterized low-complexity protein
MKKKLLIVAGASVLALGAVTAVTVDYNQYKNNQNKVALVAQRKAAEKAEAEAKATAAERKALVDQLNAQVAECKKGAAVYAQLTPFQKARVAAPVCGTPVVQ